METPQQSSEHSIPPEPSEASQPTMPSTSHIEKKWWIIFGSIATILIVFFVYALTLFLSSRQTTSDDTSALTEQNNQQTTDVSPTKELPTPKVAQTPTFQSYLDGLSYTENDEEGTNLATYTINGDR
ncbi:MAG: hypothetical protein ACD_48C00093G0001, partial [uncultured bacterium]